MYPIAQLERIRILQMANSMGYVMYHMTEPSSDLAKKLAKSAVVAASAQVFTRLGFAAARVEDILEAAGIARRTFYKHFTGKEDVLSALYDLATSELLRVIAADVEREQDRLAAVRRCIDLYLDYHVDNAGLVKVLVEQAVRSDSPLAEGRRRFRRDLVRLLDDAVRERTGVVHDPLLYAALLSALEGLSLDLLAKPATRAEVDRAKAVMHLLIARVLASPD